MRGHRNESFFGQIWPRLRVFAFTGKRRGTTLIEVAMVTVIVGVGVTAMMEFVGSATRANSAISDTPVALSIVRAGHEWAKNQSYADLEDCFPKTVSNNKVTYGSFVPTDAPVNSDSPILSVTGSALAAGPATKIAYGQWAQRFSMRKVDPKDLKTTDTTGSSPAMEVTVTALKDGQAVSSLSKLYYYYAKSGS